MKNNKKQKMASTHFDAILAPKTLQNDTQKRSKNEQKSNPKKEQKKERKKTPKSDPKRPKPEQL